LTAELQPGDIIKIDERAAMVISTHPYNRCNPRGRAIVTPLIADADKIALPSAFSCLVIEQSLRLVPEMVQALELHERDAVSVVGRVSTAQCATVRRMINVLLLDGKFAVPENEQLRYFAVSRKSREVNGMGLLLSGQRPPSPTLKAMPQQVRRVRGRPHRAFSGGPPPYLAGSERFLAAEGDTTAIYVSRVGIDLTIIVESLLDAEEARPEHAWVSIGGKFVSGADGRGDDSRIEFPALDATTLADEVVTIGVSSLLREEVFYLIFSWTER
jgi:hypothetical protein